METFEKNKLKLKEMLKDMFEGKETSHQKCLEIIEVFKIMGSSVPDYSLTLEVSLRKNESAES